MNNTRIGEGCELYKVIAAENVRIENHVKMGFGEEVPNETDPHIYNSGIVTVGEMSVIPADVTVGKNTCIFGATSREDYTDNYLACGKTLIKAGDEH